MHKKRTLQITACLVILQLSLMLACKSAVAVPALFASATPTATITPSPTSTPTQTPSPTPLPSGIQFETLPNGDTQVIDYVGGYVFSLSEDWAALPADRETIIEMADTLKRDNPEFADALLNMKDMESDAFRLVALNNNRDTYEQGNFANLNVISLKDRFSASMDLDLLVELNVGQLSVQLPNAEILSSGVAENANGIPYGYIDINLKADLKDRQINAYEKILLIQIDDNVNLFSFAVSDSRRENFVPVIQEIIDTIQPLKIFLADHS